MRYLTATDILISYLPQRTGYHGSDVFFNLVTDTKKSANNLPATFLCNYAPYAMHGSSTDVRPVYVQINFSNVNRAEGGKETRSDFIVAEINTLSILPLLKIDSFGFFSKTFKLTHFI